jgi:hypothetical protein
VRLLFVIVVLLAVGFVVFLIAAVAEGVMAGA